MALGMKDSFFFIPSENLSRVAGRRFPLVAGLAANLVVTTTELRDRECLSQIVGDELRLQVHG